MKKESSAKFKTQSLFPLVLAILCAQTAAKIVDNGIWTGANFSYNESSQKYSVENGLSVFIDPAMSRRVSSGTITWIGSIDNIFSTANVLLVNELVSQADWERLFPKAKPEFTYLSFLKAVAQFPAFCSEYKNVGPNLTSSRSACMRELATLLAHVIYESG